MSGSNQIRAIVPKETKLSDQRAFAINEPMIDYRLIPVYEPDKASMFVLGNLSSLQHDALGDKHDIETGAAREYAGRFTEQFTEVDLQKISCGLFPVEHDIQNTPEMKAETERIHRIYADDDSVRTIITAMSPEVRQEIIHAFRDNAAAARKFLIENDKAGLSQFAEPTRQFLVAYRASLAHVAQNNREEYEHLVDSRLARIAANNS